MDLIGELCKTLASEGEQKLNLESRAKDARWIRTLTLILSLAGRGEGDAGWVRAALLTGRDAIPLLRYRNVVLGFWVGE